ncbi:DUF4403 family protein [Polymorphobacter fuscus]|nr:DUF4403 family protein [Polymorphobacter fuscus]NJC09438.1 hypothetical protein [Polymorphobacter fuscus]
MPSFRLPIVIALLLALLAGCERKNTNLAPPRVTTATPIVPPTSTIVIPISARIADLEAALNAEVPHIVHEIDKQTTCLKAARVTACVVPKLKCKGLKCEKTGCSVGLDNARITPDISCRIVGEVTRGPIRLAGSGNVIDLVMPVSATIAAKDIGHVIKTQDATGAADVHARIRLGMVGDWQPTAKVEIDYEWTQKPGISLLGERITFASKADPQLAKVIARLEADTTKYLARLHPRDRIESGWKQAFTALMLNRSNPPVWLRVTPQALRYNGYRIEDDRLVLDLKAVATTEGFVGERPPDPPVTPLPTPADIPQDAGFTIRIPIVAQYAELEPVLEKALRKLARQPIVVPGAGPVDVRFGKPIVYATTGNRLAIGLPMQVAADGEAFSTTGTVWATGIPYNQPGSQQVRVRDLTIDGRGDATFDIMLAVARSPGVLDAIGGGLTQNFGRDYAKLLGKIDRALMDKRVGDFILDARIDQVRNGVVKPLGQGVYMPVDTTGTATLRYDPRPVP